MEPSDPPPPLGTTLPGPRPVVGPREYVLFESDPVRPLALSADSSRLFAVNTPDNRLEIFRIDGGAPVYEQSVPVGLEPVALALSPDGTVSVVNPRIRFQPQRRDDVEFHPGRSRHATRRSCRPAPSCLDVRDVRLRRAAQLLRVSGLSVDGIAGKVGFASRSHFSHAFHDEFGCSPADFRRQQS
jgi:Helix-turn-helix domain